MATETKVLTSPEKVQKEYEPLVHKLAHKAWKHNSKDSAVDYEDVLLAGFMGLENARRNFDYDMNVKFITLAYHSINNAIRAYLRKYNGTIYRPVQVFRSADPHNYTFSNIEDFSHILACNASSSIEEDVLDGADMDNLKMKIRRAANIYLSSVDKLIFYAIFVEELTPKEAAEKYTCLSKYNLSYKKNQISNILKSKMRKK